MADPIRLRTLNVLAAELTRSEGLRNGQARVIAELLVSALEKEGFAVTTSPAREPGEEG